MTTDQLPPPDRVFAIEKHGFDFIPLTERNMTLTGAGLFWAGTQANLLPMTLGALGVALGLPLWLAIAAVVVGNLFFILVAVNCVVGPRAGVPTLTFARAAFGTRGNLPNVALTWIALVSFEVLNTILAALAILAFLRVIGVPDPGIVGQLVAVVAVVAVGAVIAAFGHSAMVWIQRIASVVLLVSLVLVLAFTIGGADWTGTTAVDSGSAIVLLSIAAAANASGPISYLFNAPDYFRYLPSDVPPRKLFVVLFAVGFGMATMLGVLGAVLASQVDMSDPIGAPAVLMPTPIYLLFLLAAVIGSISNNVPTLYSSGLTLQALGVPITRLAGTLLDSVLSAALTLYVVVNGGFLDVLELFAALLIVWLLPFGATYAADAVARRWVYDPVDLHDRGRKSQYFGVNFPGIAALAAGIVVALFTIDSDVFVGPISAAMGGIDLSWIAPLPVAFAVYFALAWKRLRSPTQSELARVALERQQSLHTTEREVLDQEQTTAHQ
ncbi:purine-cytosine permease family protein [Mycolicibacterium mengxianglii]|uniref:purine-cytosine permease family protein n=1 Tax=Mycolicibacterium mengxianglii TaxID=2736649 RepID=UPI0018D028F6|nr:cytosine permease [Mycolicibacterium mengxianglii]